MDSLVEDTSPRPARAARAAAGEVPRPDAPLSVGRLHALRVGYLVVGGGLAVYKWPLLLHRPAPWTLMEGVASSMFVAMSLLALLGLRYPLRMLPVLLFETAWKLVWLLAVALPMAMTGPLDAPTRTTISNFFPMVVVLAVIPWDYVVRHYLMERGDRWRRRPAPRARAWDA